MYTEPLPGHSVPVFHTTVAHGHIINTKILRQQSGYPACVLTPFFYIEAEMLTLVQQLKTQLLRHLKVFGDTAKQRADRRRSNSIREFEGKLSDVHIVSGQGLGGGKFTAHSPQRKDKWLLFTLAWRERA